MTTTHTNQGYTSPTSQTSSEGRVQDRVSEGISSAAENVGGFVDEKARDLSEKKSKFMSNALEKARYLRETEPKQLGADLVAIVKRHPILSVAIGTGMGLLMSRSRRRRRSRRM